MTTRYVSIPEIPAAELLRESGYVVVPMLEESERVEMAEQMVQYLTTAPEYTSEWQNRRAKGTKTEQRFVAGGFGALALASSFHNPCVRRLRMLAHPNAAAVLAPLADGRNLEQVMDRIGARVSGDSPVAESFHRDVAKCTSSGDSIFGGWVNLNDSSQYFSCVPESHIGFETQQSGFVPIVGKEEKAALRLLTVKVEIPPGHEILFYECLIHEVVSVPQTQQQLRLFLGFRLTHSSESLVEDLERILSEQAVVKIKSGQIPPEYPQGYWMYSKQMPLLLEHSVKFVEAAKHTKTFKSGQRKGESHIIVRQHHTSLREMGLAEYPQYTAEERALLSPTPFPTLVSTPVLAQINTR